MTPASLTELSGTDRASNNSSSGAATAPEFAASKFSDARDLIKVKYEMLSSLSQPTDDQAPPVRAQLYGPGAPGTISLTVFRAVDQ